MGVELETLDHELARVGAEENASKVLDRPVSAVARLCRPRAHRRQSGESCPRLDQSSESFLSEASTAFQSESPTNGFSSEGSRLSPCHGFQSESPRASSHSRPLSACTADTKRTPRNAPSRRISNMSKARDFDIESSMPLSPYSDSDKARARSRPSFVERRRSNIRQFRIMEKMELDQEEVPVHSRRHSSGPTMSASRSLPSLSKSHHESSSASDDALLGFAIGDKVTTAGGHDQTGPWAQMGYGTVVGLDKKKGYLLISFSKTSETYSLKAANLKLARPDHRLRLQKSSSNGNDIGEGRKQKAGDTTIFNAAGGLQIGDVVTDVRIGGCFTVVSIGDLGNVQVFSKSLGTTSTANARNLVKYKKHAKKVVEKYAFKYESSEADAVEKYLIVGDYVKATNESFAQFGVGLIRGLCEKSGMAKVQFDSGGDTWVIAIDDLQKEDAPERLFRLPGKTNERKLDMSQLEERNRRRHMRQAKAREKRARSEARNDDSLDQLKQMLIENDTADDHHVARHF